MIERAFAAVPVDAGTPARQRILWFALCEVVSAMGLLNSWRSVSPDRSEATPADGTSTAPESLLLPGFLRQLADPAIQTVLLCGCGGGFDFVHSLTLYPELVRLGKTVVIGSYSFGDPTEITGAARVFTEGRVTAVRVVATCTPAQQYGPEVHVCSFLDLRYPSSAPHFVYAYYARDFTVPLLTRLYQQFIDRHAIDAIVLVDGGSDSLMVGDEEGLGDPIEDAVSVTTVASLKGLKARVLISRRFVDSLVLVGRVRINHRSASAVRFLFRVFTARYCTGSVYSSSCPATTSASGYSSHKSP